MRTAAVISLALLAPAAASAEPASPWIADVGAKIRLVDAGPGPALGERLAAIEIRLENGWKTYWRQPGANGVPPRFDFSASQNLAEARTLYPTPERLDDPDGVTNVYHGEAVLPVLLRPADPAKPVILRLSADFGVCERICVPAHAELSLALREGGGAGSAGDAAKTALTRVPKRQPLGATPLGVLSVERTGGTKDAGELSITVAAAWSEKPELFAETGDGEYAPAPSAGEPAGDGRAVFRMTLDDAQPPASGLRFTLAAGGRAVETAVPLDAIGGRP